MRNGWNPRIDQGCYRVGLLMPTFHLDRLALRLFQNLSSCFNRVRNVDLPDRKRQVDNNHGPFGSPGDDLSMIDHLLECHWDRRVVSLDNHPK